MMPEQNNENLVACPVCGKKFRQLHRHVLTAHGLSQDDFVARYPGVVQTSEGSHVLQAVRSRTTSSVVQIRLYNYLSALLPGRVETEYRIGSMFIDIAMPDIKLAIEVDGTYYHGTGERMTAQQERSAMFSARKAKALQALGWTLVSLADEALVFEPGKVLKERLGMLPGIQAIPDNLDLMPDRPSSCLHCGKRLSIKQFYSHRQFCDKTCRTAYFRKHPEMRGCMQCGKHPATFVWHRRRFCDKSCFEAYMKTHAKTVSTCLYCGKTVYSVTQEPSQFCDSECMNKFKTERPEEWTCYRSGLSANSEYNRRRREEGHVEAECAVCGKRIVKHRRDLKKSASGKLFCSHECYVAYRRATYVNTRPRRHNES